MQKWLEKPSRRERGIFAQALIVRRALRSIDPWKSIDEVQSANRAISAPEVERAVAKAVKQVRKNRRV